MIRKKVVCDKCSSIFSLHYNDNDTSHDCPSYCTFCGDEFDTKNADLDFNNNELMFPEDEDLDEGSDDGEVYWD